MAARPLAFGLRFRHQGRTVRVAAHEREPQRWLVEHGRPRAGAPERREHGSLASALRDFARVWRGRLN